LRNVAIVLIFALIVFLFTGCNKATKSIDGAEEFCKDKGGVAYHQQFQITSCKNGAITRE